MRLTKLTNFRLGVLGSFVTTVLLMATGLPTSYTVVVFAGIAAWLSGEWIG